MPSTNKRLSISKKLRFDVFKRDSFTCQYCGRSAPEITLEIDHLQPVSAGGKNEMMNLVTSCYDCNRGKGARLLSDDASIKKQKAQLDMLNDRREQLKMMLAWKEELSNLVEEQIFEIECLIKKLSRLSLTDIGRQDVRSLIKRFGFMEVYESTEIAFTKYEGDYAFKKIGGVCYNRKNGIKGK